MPIITNQFICLNKIYKLRVNELVITYIIIRLVQSGNIQQLLPLVGLNIEGLHVVVNLDHHLVLLEGVVVLKLG